MIKLYVLLLFFFSSRRRHTRCALVTGVQTCALPIFCRDPTVITGWSGRRITGNLLAAAVAWFIRRDAARTARLARRRPEIRPGHAGYRYKISCRRFRADWKRVV